MTSLSSSLLKWFKIHGRHDLPWQKNLSPYRVWVSEIMLQQTQVKTVIPYYRRFIKRFPQINDLSSANIDQVLYLWTGLGYYARARNLHKTARILTSQYDSQFPDTVEDLETLPGIGRSTAGAILALSLNKRAPILDGNVKRVLTRFYSIPGWPEQTKTKNQLWAIAEKNTPLKNFAQYTQAIMDLGATVCKRSKPDCCRCPLEHTCNAFTLNKVEDYPSKKPKKKPMPIKKICMYVFENEFGEVLLERRPPQGIWGSLYSFPEKRGQKDDTTSSKTIKHLNSKSRSSEDFELKSLRHTFSHFHLDIQPTLLKVSKRELEIDDSARWVWYSLNNPSELGLAAPVKNLLSTLSARN